MSKVKEEKIEEIKNEKTTINVDTEENNANISNVKEDACLR